MRLNKITRILMIVGLALSGCSRDKAPERARDFGPTGSGNGPTTPQEIPDLANALQMGSQTACARLDALRGWGRDRDLGFSFLREVHPKDKTFTGGLDIGENPFVQLFFGEKFTVMTPDEFLKEVEAQHKAGTISDTQYTVIQAAKHIPSLLRKIQLSATNTKLEEGFPGVFGQTADMSKSLPLLLIQKASGGKFELGQSSIVTARVPLFVSEDWAAFNQDARVSLSAIIKSAGADVTTPDGTRERLCGLVLWQRAFSQLLALKGYVRPEMFDNDSNQIILKKINKLSADYQEFKKLDRTGAFVDPRLKKSVVLQASDIATYNAALKPFFPAAKLPLGRAQAEPASFDQSLDMLEALSYLYAATSPAAPWVKKNSDYVFGDIQNPKNTAIVPADAHSLALGLLRINLKNLAAFHIVQLNSAGGELKPGETLAGFIPMDDKTKGVSLAHVMQLTRISVVLDQSLDYFKSAKPEQWAQLNPVYDRKTLAALLGDSYLPKAEVEKLLTPEELATVLKSTLVKFRLPLASLLMQMGVGEKCVGHLSWDLSTGARKPTRFCDGNEAKDVKAALRLLALHIKSPLLYKNSLP